MKNEKTNDDAAKVAVGAFKKDEGKAPIYQGFIQYFPRAIEAVANISKFGYDKYGTWGGWLGVDDGLNRYMDAKCRHMIDEAKGERTPTGGTYLHPRQVLRELEKAMPKRVMVSTDIGNINAVANSYLRFDEPRSFFAPMSFGNCGYSLPTMIGAKAAAMDRPAVAYAGDGAWGMSMSELMTAVRHDIPVTAVVFHNRQWGAEKKNQVDFYNRRFVAGELESESFAGIAIAMGAEGIVVDKLEDVGPAFKRAIDMQMNEGKTCVIEIMCTRELGDPFRRDALAKPVRFLDKYKDYV